MLDNIFIFNSGFPPISEMKTLPTRPFSTGSTDQLRPPGIPGKSISPVPGKTTMSERPKEGSVPCVRDLIHTAIERNLAQDLSTNRNRKYC